MSNENFRTEEELFSVSRQRLEQERDNARRELMAARAVIAISRESEACAEHANNCCVEWCTDCRSSEARNIRFDDVIAVYDGVVRAVELEEALRRIIDWYHHEPKCNMREVPVEECSCKNNVPTVRDIANAALEKK